MTTVPARPGRSWLLAGSILMLLTGLAHTAGQFGPMPPGFEAPVAAMQAARFDMGLGMSPSLFDIFQDLTFTMSVTFFALGALNLLLALHRTVTVELQRPVALINVLWLAAFVVLSYRYAVPPPLICGAVMLPVFGVAFLKSRPAPDA